LTYQKEIDILILGETMIKRLSTLILITLTILMVILITGKSIDTWNKTSNNHMASNSVTILGIGHGGSGVILYSTPIMSAVLTNRHICQAIAHRGNVISDTNEVFSILNYRVSLIHDLCQIFVAGDLNGGVDVATTPPLYYDEAIVVGHPHLMPTIITKGHFTHKMIVNITGILGEVETQGVSAIIAPGSSGSAVYNSDGDLSGLIFAGRSDIGFGLMVPYEYLKVFLDIELKTLEFQFIKPEEEQNMFQSISSPIRSPFL
jgi:hypothetical protein